MDESNLQKSRIAEMAMELFGAKMVTEFLKEAWAFASPEAKQEIADACLKLAKEQVGHVDSWDARRIVEGWVRQRFEARRSDIQAEIDKQVDDWMAKWTPTAVSQIVLDIGNRVMMQLRDELGRKFSAAVQAVR